MATDATTLFASGDGAQSVTYRLPDGSETSLTANVWDVLTENRDQRGIQTIVSTRNVTLKASELSDVNMRATVVISGTEWSIVRIIYQDSIQVSLELQRHGLHEQSRPGYRRQ